MSETVLDGDIVDVWAETESGSDGRVDREHLVAVDEVILRIQEGSHGDCGWVRHRGIAVECSLQCLVCAVLQPAISLGRFASGMLKMPLVANKYVPSGPRARSPLCTGLWFEARI